MMLWQTIQFVFWRSKYSISCSITTGPVVSRRILPGLISSLTVMDMKQYLYTPTKDEGEKCITREAIGELTDRTIDGCSRNMHKLDLQHYILMMTISTCQHHIHNESSGELSPKVYKLRWSSPVPQKRVYIFCRWMDSSNLTGHDVSESRSSCNATLFFIDLLRRHSFRSVAYSS